MDKQLSFYESRVIVLKLLKRRIESIWPDVITDVTAPGKFDIDVQFQLIDPMVCAYSQVVKDIDRSIEYAEYHVEEDQAKEYAEIMGGTDEAVQNPDRDEDVTVGEED